MTGRPRKKAPSVSGFFVISSKLFTVEPPLRIDRGFAAAFEVLLHALLCKNWVVCSPLVAVKPARFATFQLPVDGSRCHTQPIGDVCHPVAVQVSRGNLLAVLKVYVSVLPHHFTPFLLCFSSVDGKKINAIERVPVIRRGICSFAFNITSRPAWDYIAKFIDNIDGIVLSSSSQVYKNVIAGEYAVGVSYEDPVVQAIIDNKDNPDADLSLVYPEEGAVWLPAGVAIVKNAPNMDNAKLFVDYVLSEEAQTALSKTTIRGTMTSIAQDCPEMKPFEEINVVYEDQAAVAELQTEMLEKWTNLLTK